MALALVMGSATRNVVHGLVSLPVFHSIPPETLFKLLGTAMQVGVALLLLDAPLCVWVTHHLVESMQLRLVVAVSQYCISAASLSLTRCCSASRLLSFIRVGHHQPVVHICRSGDSPAAHTSCMFLMIGMSRPCAVWLITLAP